MTKYFIAGWFGGAVAGALLVLGVYAGAATQGARGLGVVDEVWMRSIRTSIIKIYDKDANVICYVTDGVYANGVSCLKNN